MSALAESPNVYIKLSGLMLGEKKWQPDHAHAAANAIIAAFGIDRVMLASNFPVDRLFAPLDELFGHYRKWLLPLPDADQQKVLYENVCRIFRLEA